MADASTPPLDAAPPCQADTPGATGAYHSPGTAVGVSGDDERERPGWFEGFLADREILKRSAHTIAAYRRDFDAIAEIIVGGDDLAALRLSDLTKDALKAAFGLFAKNHSAASVRRCWSTWNTLCTYVYSEEEVIAANPMTNEEVSPSRGYLSLATPISP